MMVLRTIHTDNPYFCNKCKMTLSKDDFRIINVPGGKEIPYIYCKECEEKSVYNRKRTERTSKIKIRLKIINMLGCKCICCGETNWWNLTFDYIIPPKKRESLYGIYNRLIKESDDNIQCLCLGCDNSKGNGERCNLEHNLNIKPKTKIIPPKTLEW